MDFEHSSGHRELRQKVRSFVEQDVLPVICEYEEKSIFPLEIFQNMGRHGFFKAHVANEYGGFRLGNASAALGIGNAAFDKTLGYVRQREVGAHKVADFQGIRWRLAEMSVQLEASRLLRDKAAVLADKEKEAALEASQAKLFCAQVSNQVVGECIQLTGRYGCLRDSLFELYLRDARVLGTAGGTLEVMKNNIAKRVIGG